MFVIINNTQPLIHVVCFFWHKKNKNSVNTDMIFFDYYYLRKYSYYRISFSFFSGYIFLLATFFYRRAIQIKVTTNKKKKFIWTEQRIIWQSSMNDDDDDCIAIICYLFCFLFFIATNKNEIEIFIAENWSDGVWVDWIDVMNVCVWSMDSFRALDLRSENSLILDFCFFLTLLN